MDGGEEENTCIATDQPPPTIAPVASVVEGYVVPKLSTMGEEIAGASSSQQALDPMVIIQGARELAQQQQQQAGGGDTGQSNQIQTTKISNLSPEHGYYLLNVQDSQGRQQVGPLLVLASNPEKGTLEANVVFERQAEVKARLVQLQTGYQNIANLVSTAPEKAEPKEIPGEKCDKIYTTTDQPPKEKTPG